MARLNLLTSLYSYGTWSLTGVDGDLLSFQGDKGEMENGSNPQSSFGALIGIGHN
jgi:hypothetical protein